MTIKKQSIRFIETKQHLMINKKQKNRTTKFLIFDCVIGRKVRQAFIIKCTKTKVEINQNFGLLFRKKKKKRKFNINSSNISRNVNFDNTSSKNVKACVLSKKAKKEKK